MFLTILPFRVYKNQEGLYKYIPPFCFDYSYKSALPQRYE